jgi:hypothetical protein
VTWSAAGRLAARGGVAVSFMVPLYLCAHGLGGALEVADELRAEGIASRVTDRGGVAEPTVREAPIVAMAARRPDALRGPLRCLDATAHGGESCPRRAKQSADGAFERLAVGVETKEPSRLRVWPARLDRIRRSTPAAPASGHASKGRFVFRFSPMSARCPALPQRATAHGLGAAADPPRRADPARLA